MGIVMTGKRMTLKSENGAVNGMGRFRTLALLGLVLVLVMVVLAGCGAKENGSGSDGGSASETLAQSDGASQGIGGTSAAGSDVSAAASGTQGSTQKIDIKVAALKGPTAIGLVEVMDNAKKGTASNNYEFTIAGSADEFTADLLKGDIQIAALPCNAAATLYNKSNGKITVLGINTLGVLYVLDTGDSVQSVTDLKGKTIYITGKGTTPEYTLRHLLSAAGIDPDKDVDIQFKSEATEVAALMQKGDGEVIAMLPQPYVTTVTSTVSGARIALDVTAEWEKLEGSDSTVVTGVIVANTQFANENPQALQAFLAEYEHSVKYVNENVEAAANLVEEFDIFKAAVAKVAIPYCHITLVTGSDMKTKVGKYLGVLYGENPSSIGGAMPGDDFYYGVK